MAAEQALPFESLPLEVVSDIFNFLPLAEKKAARLVCNRWRYVLDNKYYGTLTFRPKLTNDSIQSFLVSYRKMDLVSLWGLTSRFPRMSSPKNKFPQIQRARIVANNSQAAIGNFLKYGLESTESLTIDWLAFVHIRRYVLSGILRKVQWNNLTKLKLGVYMGDELSERKQLETSTTFLKFGRIPNLQDVDLYLDHRGAELKGDRIRLQRLFSHFYGFLVAHSQSLKILTCFVMMCRRNWSEFLKKPEILVPPIPTLKLESCTIRSAGDGNGRPEYWVWPSLYGSQLKTFEFRLDIENSAVKEYFRQILDRNSKSLETVNIRYPNLDLVWLKNCASLKSLTFSTQNLVRTQENDHVTFPHPKLSNLKLTLGYTSGDTLPTQLQQFILQAGKSIQNLDMGIDGYFLKTGWSCLNSCAGLKSLKISYVDLNIEEIAVVFLNLINLNIRSLQNILMTPFLDWVVNRMPKLQLFYLEYATSLTLHDVQKLLTLKNLKKIDIIIDGNRNELEYNVFKNIVQKLQALT